MTTSPYSQDLRKRILNYLDTGKTQKEASEVFGVHRNTISRWLVRYRREGNYAARVRLGRTSKIDYKGVELYVQNNPDIKLRDIGSEFGISGWHAARILKKLGYSYKKKRLPMWKQVKRSEKNI